MAIDTQNKRRSVQAYLLGAMRPVADATIAAADRATLGWVYAGLTYSGVVPPVVIPFFVSIASIGRLMKKG